VRVDQRLDDRLDPAHLMFSASPRRLSVLVEGHTGGGRAHA